MEDHLESLKKRAFVPADDEEVEADEKRLKQIREVSADYLAAMERTRDRTEGNSMTKDKPSVTLPGKVEKVIKPAANEPEKAQISIEGGDPLYREIRIENTLTDANGQEVHLGQDDEVDVRVEADKVSPDLQDEGDTSEQDLQEPKAS
jgi:hypothetical protein